MSAAASRLHLESPNTTQSGDLPMQEEQAERSSFEKLMEMSTPSSSSPVIAVDLDDVLSQTNQAVAEWHNEKFGTNMDLSTFYYYYYWKNPYWGTPEETFLKVKEFYSTDLMYKAEVVPGAREGIQALRNMGFRLVIVTARTEENADKSWRWVDDNFPGLFDTIICTGQFRNAHKTGHELVTKLSKAQVCYDLGAKILIDDSVENALECATHMDPVTVLVFGDYEWNKRLSGSRNPNEQLSFEERLKMEEGREFWKDETVELPDEAPIFRVNGWAEAVRWVERAKDEGRL